MTARTRRTAGAWLVTGAASGLGRELARRLAERGESVALWDRDADGLRATLEMLGDARVHAEPVDVTEAAAVADAAAATHGALGSIAHVAHAAGVLRVGSAEHMSASDYRLMMEVNYLGSVHVAQATIPYLREAAERGRGRSTLLFVSSVAGLRGMPELAGYSATKFAVIGFAQALRDELVGSGIDVRVLCPPPADTQMVRDLPALPPVYKLSKMFTAEEIVEGALRGLERDEWILLVDLNSRALYAVARHAPRIVDLVIRRATRDRSGAS